MSSTEEDSLSLLKKVIADKVISRTTVDILTPLLN